MQINLFYLSPNPYGGWMTFTAHLCRALKVQGHQVNLYKIGNKSETKSRPFGYGVMYRNLSIKDAVSMRGLRLITAMARNYVEDAMALFNVGAKVVIHDPTELKHKAIPEWFCDEEMQKRMVVIRRSMLKALPHATFIQHPFIPWTGALPPKTKHAVSTCRIDFDKHTELLLDANRLLPDDKKIDIKGFENRLYTKFKVVPKYPEWVQSVGHYERGWGSVYGLLGPTRFALDMSEIKGDGGGTQYSFLEAIDAGCLLVLNTKWRVNPETDVMQDCHNCIMANDGADIAHLLLQGDWEDSADIRQNASLILADHTPTVVAPLYQQFMED